MKKTVDVKFPHSASLFQFCRKVLDHKFGGIRVIDQDVGQILGFDPADCSHWKKGKKNIRSIQAMKSIAEHLGVDEKLVVDIASGDLDDLEAFHEYSGYGAFALDTKILETAKKDFYRRNAATWTKDKENQLRDAFNTNEAAIDRIVGEIHARINFLEAPLYLPEIVAAYPELKLNGVEAANLGGAAVKMERNGSGGTILTYAVGTEMRPYVRYRLAKAMANHFVPEEATKLDDGGDFGCHLSDVKGNLFAAKLLAPAPLVRREMVNVNVAKDVIAQLSESFWVSKAFMNRRLKDILQSPAGL